MSTATPAPLATGGDTYAATEAAKQAYAGHEIAADSEYSLLVRLTSDSAQQELTKVMGESVGNILAQPADISNYLHGHVHLSKEMEHFMHADPETLFHPDRWAELQVAHVHERAEAITSARLEQFYMSLGDALTPLFLQQGKDALSECHKIITPQINTLRDTCDKLRESMNGMGDEHDKLESLHATTTLETIPISKARQQVVDNFTNDAEAYI